MSRYETSKKLLSPVWGHLSESIVERASGSFIYTTCGKKLLDFSTGIGVVNTGHCHPRVVAAAQEQVGKLIHGQLNIVYHKPVLELVEELKPVVPEGLDTFFFSNSGAEAVEASIKLARHATKKQNIITFSNSFHGRTVGTMSLGNSKIVYRNQYGPLMAGVHVAPYAYCHRCPCKEQRKGADSCCNQPLHAVEMLLRQQTGPADTAAILLEPVLGEGGYVQPPKSFMQGLRKICDKHGILLIYDEVQTGFGRTGKYFAAELSGVKPDILVFAKAIASGFPLSGLVASAETHKHWQQGSHGGTYGANAVACAAAVATQRVIKEEKLVENAAARGEQLTKLLQQLKDKYPQISEVRGPGLMVGVEFYDERDNAYPFPGHDSKHTVKYGFTGALTKKCLNHGMLILNTGAHETLRFIPPLNVSAEEIELGVEIFEKGLKDTLKELAN
jgi:4-aminobutyrate aminotransferase